MPHVTIDPLQPPFDDDVVVLALKGWPQKLAMSEADGKRLKAMLRELIVDRPEQWEDCLLDFEEVGTRIRISVIPS
jgi:hypothetical protein